MSGRPISRNAGKVHLIMNPLAFGASLRSMVEVVGGAVIVGQPNLCPQPFVCLFIWLLNQPQSVRLWLGVFTGTNEALPLK